MRRLLAIAGEWPTGDIDHKDTNRSNNRWDNLRPATRSQNLSNSGAKPFNPIGLKGVSVFRDKWQSSISDNYRKVHLGTFDCPAAAHFAYIIAADNQFGEFARFE